MRGKYLLLFLLVCLHPLTKAQPSDSTLYYQISWQAFYALPDVNQLIDVSHPDYALLDAALFHATNEGRSKEGLPPFRYARALHQAAEQHSTAMIEQNFYDHYNTRDLSFYFPASRIASFNSRIIEIGENIAQYCLIDTKSYYCLRKSSTGKYSYYDCDTDREYRAYTYLAFARYAVNCWMNSPAHRRNILNPHFDSVGCAARFSPDPYQQRQLPFARLTQDFGVVDRSRSAATASGK